MFLFLETYWEIGKKTSDDIAVCWVASAGCITRSVG